MRDLGVLWDSCQKGTIPKDEWEYQRQLVIGGVTYTDSSIKELSFDRGLIYDYFTLGNCISSKLVATIVPKGEYTIPKNIGVLLYIRIETLNDGATPWVLFGTYYVYDRIVELDKITLECYDAMRYLEVPYLSEEDVSEWPMPCSLAITRITDYLNVFLDVRTSLDSSFLVDKPDGMSMREVLSYIGSMNCGNWCITEEGQLRLVKPSLGQEVQLEVTYSDAKKVTLSEISMFDKVVFKYGQSEDEKYIAGTGDNELIIYNPWSTQEIADYVLGQLSLYVYHTFYLQSADIDPAMELGDLFYVNELPATFWQVAYSKRMYADITIPSKSEAGDFSELGGTPGSSSPTTGGGGATGGTGYKRIKKADMRSDGFILTLVDGTVETYLYTIISGKITKITDEENFETHILWNNDVEVGEGT